MRRINTGINPLWTILPLLVPTFEKYLFARTCSPFIGRIPRIIASDKQTTLLTGYRGGEGGSNNNERFMKLMVEDGKTFLDRILFKAFNAVYSQFSLFPFCLSVFDRSHEISQCTSKIIRGTECVNKGHGVNGFIDEQINNALIKQLTRWWK